MKMKMKYAIAFADVHGIEFVYAETLEDAFGRMVQEIALAISKATTTYDELDYWGEWFGEDEVPEGVHLPMFKFRKEIYEQVFEQGYTEVSFTFETGDYFEVHKDHIVFSIEDTPTTHARVIELEPVDWEDCRW